MRATTLLRTAAKDIPEQLTARYGRTEIVDGKITFKGLLWHGEPPREIQEVRTRVPVTVVKASPPQERFADGFLEKAGLERKLQIRKTVGVTGLLPRAEDVAEEAKEEKKKTLWELEAERIERDKPPRIVRMRQETDEERAERWRKIREFGPIQKGYGYHKGEDVGVETDEERRLRLETQGPPPVESEKILLKDGQILERRVKPYVEGGLIRRHYCGRK